MAAQSPTGSVGREGKEGFRALTQKHEKTEGQKSSAPCSTREGSAFHASCPQGSSAMLLGAPTQARKEKSTHLHLASSDLHVPPDWAFLSNWNSGFTGC